ARRLRADGGGAAHRVGRVPARDLRPGGAGDGARRRDRDRARRRAVRAAAALPDPLPAPRRGAAALPREMTRRARVGLAAAAGYASLLGAIWFGVSRWSAMDAAPGALGRDQVARIFVALRAALDERGAPPGRGEGIAVGRGVSGRITLYCD